ncbi:MAG: hypothetical protein D6707_09860 [Bacteroidetes bacterium]|nr:MAG: hypothetical protein D6707_09860 [Bacteroidota bacterium]
MIRIPYLKIDFDFPLKPYETNKLRRQVIALTKGNEVLYHNHIKDGYRYDYPLIQYKSIRQTASILYLADGIEGVPALYNQLAESNSFNHLKIKKIHSYNYPAHFYQSGLKYKLINWLPLNGENFIKYKQLKTQEEKEQMLKTLFVANVVSFAKGTGWNLHGEIEIFDFKLLNEKWISFKNIKFLGFNVELTTNVFLPPYVGLGKGAAHNYGVVYHYN